MGIAIGLLMLGGVFSLGWMIFTRKVGLQPGRTASFDRVFPRIVGGVFMFGAVYGLLILVHALLR
ncbi:hypothetical protein [Streptomyces sp. NPDC059466]|uniref:hypothetical protein n=1 Tax=unclassified Streptomyces TaxID=2593676 RepID=UPI00369B7A42